MKTKNEIKPEVGMPCTYRVGSDRYAYEVTRVSPHGTIVYARRQGADAHTDRKFILGVDGVYRLIGSGKSTRLTLGIAETVLDPSF